MGKKKEIKLILIYIKKNKLLAFLTALTLSVSSLAGGISMGMIIPILQSLSNSKDNNVFVKAAKSVFASFNVNYSLLNLMIAFSLILFIKTGLSSFQQYLSKYISSSIVYQLRIKAFSNLMKFQISYFYKHKIGDIIASLYTSSNYSGKTIGSFIQMLVSISFFLAYMTINFVISPLLSVIIICITIIAYTFIIPKFAKGKAHGKEDKIFTDTIASYIINVLGGIKTVKAFHNEEKHLNEFSSISNKYRKLQMRMKKNKILANLYFEPLISIMFIMLIVFSIEVLKLEVIKILVFFYIFNRTIPRLNKINKIYLDIKIYLPHFFKVHELIERNETLVSDTNGVEITTFKNSIEFKDVYFKYPSSEDYVLKNVNFHIKKNEITAIIGRSGIGKTTLIDIIIKHHDPDKGKILIDGIDLVKIKRSNWHNIIGVVEQEVYLFNDTIYNNICYGKLDAEKEDVLNSAKLANAYDFIDSLPDKFDTVVGERGIKLSGGQKQRISLARALINDPEILILDEATSALDNESEKLIQNAIEELSNKKTIIIIAHRDSTIASADKVFNIKDGQII